jgi:hypothetical protein
MIGALLLVSSLAGLLVPAVVLAYFREQIDWSKQLAGPTWDFGKSWASNITAAGTVLGYAALLACFSPTAQLHFLPRAGYLTVGTIAGGLPILAPLVFTVLSRILQARHNQAATSISFLLATAVTIWGLTLQLLLGACLLWELHTVNILPGVIAFLFVALLLVLAGAVVAYAALTAADTLKKEIPSTEHVEEVIENLREPIGAQVPVRPPPKAWSLL